MEDLLRKNDLGQQPQPMVETAPGVFRVSDPATLGKMCLAKWKPAGAGTHKLVPVTNHRAVLNKALLKKLGLEHSLNTINRLGRAGFVTLIPYSPRVRLLDLDSLAEHETRVMAAERAGESFWSGDNLRRWKEVLSQEDRSNCERFARGQVRS